MLHFPEGKPETDEISGEKLSALRLDDGYVNE